MSPVKEPSFFAYEGDKINLAEPGKEVFNSKVVTNFDQYCALFKSVSDEKAIGEVSPAYLAKSYKAAERIKYYLPNVKLIAVLRDPVERAYSSFMMQIRDKSEPIADFLNVIHESERRKKENHGSNRNIIFSCTVAALPFCTAAEASSPLTFGVTSHLTSGKCGRIFLGGRDSTSEWRQKARRADETRLRQGSELPGSNLRSNH